MINFQRVRGPSDALTRLKERSDRLNALLDAGEAVPQSLLDSYRASDVKELIRLETHEKCIYCESKITHVYFGDIEHLTPKAIFLHLTLDFENLGYACACWK